MEKKVVVLDYILVPAGVIGMVIYHAWLVHRILNRPSLTLIGINAINRRFWVRAMMQDVSKNGVLAVQTLRNNIMASTLLATTAIMLSSLIAVLMTSGGGGQRSSSMGFVVVGYRSELVSSIKFFSILVCFLVAFFMNVQSIRYYSHASILINVPAASSSSDYNNIQHPTATLVTPDYVGRMVNRGSYFWSLGLRAYYFSFPLFLWIFGPIPMFLCCVALVFLLYFLDVTLDFRCLGSSQTQTDGNHCTTATDHHTHQNSSIL